MPRQYDILYVFHDTDDHSGRARSPCSVWSHTMVCCLRCAGVHGGLQPVQFRLHHLHDLRETQEAWMTPVSELFIVPEQALHRTPLLAFREPEGEFRSHGIRRPSACRSDPPHRKDDV